MAGPGIRKDERVYGATLLDIAPTVLALSGLEVADDMDGKVLANAFEEPIEVERISSWELVEGECGMHPAGAEEDPFEARQMVKQMAALGYVEEDLAEEGGDTDKQIEKVHFNNRLNLAEALMDGGLHTRALEILEELHREDPDYLMAPLHMATCYQRLGRLDECRRIAEETIERCTDESRPAFGEPMELPDEERAKLRPAERPRIVAHAGLLLGLVELESRNYAKALEHLRSAEASGLRSHHLDVTLGQCFLALGRVGEAESAFGRALAVHGEDYRALDGMAQVRLRQNRPEEAADYALDAVGLLHQYPTGHYHLGLALAKLGRNDTAIQAFEHSLAMRRGASRTHGNGSTGSRSNRSSQA